MDDEKIEVSSELVVQTNFDGDALQVHLVSWYGDETERYGLWVETENGGTLLARFEPTVSYEVAVSAFVAFAFGTLVDGSERAAEVMNLQPTSDLIIPDTQTVQEISK